jgi:AraC-like DNA-binding protein
MPGYREWAAPAVLGAAVACLWAQPDLGTRQVLVLPDACTDLIWERGKGAYLAGPDTGPAPATVTGPVLGVRFAPGGWLLRTPLSELLNQRVDLAELLPWAARRLPQDLPPDQAAAELLGIAAALVCERSPDPMVAQASGLLHDPRVSNADISAATGVSSRQLRRRFHASVGYGPKTLQRVLRFRRFVSRVDAGQAGDLASAALAAGYADQAHLSRECVEFAGLTPAALVRSRAR